MTKLCRFVLAATMLLTLVALSANASTSISTFPTWNGTDRICCIAGTYGEAITTPSAVASVSQFSFWLQSPQGPGYQFQAFVAPWDNNNYFIPGGLAGVSYLSAVQTATSSNWVQYTFSGLNVAVTPGTIYMFGVTIDNVFANDSGYFAYLGGDLNTHGNSTYYFAYSNEPNGDGTYLGNNWNSVANNGCADNTSGICGQSVWDVTYNAASPTPEPGSFLLLGTGALGLAGAMRRKINL